MFFFKRLIKFFIVFLFLPVKNFTGIVDSVRDLIRSKDIDELSGSYTSLYNALSKFFAGNNASIAELKNSLTYFMPSQLKVVKAWDFLSTKWFFLKKAFEVYYGFEDIGGGFIKNTFLLSNIIGIDDDSYPHTSYSLKKIMFSSLFYFNDIVTNVFKTSLLDMAQELSNDTGMHSNSDPPITVYKYDDCKIFDNITKVTTDFLEEFDERNPNNLIFGDLIVNKSTKQTLYMILATLINRKKTKDKKTPEKAMQYFAVGEPGTGKTAMAKRLALMAGYTLHVTSVGRLLRYNIKYVIKELKRTLEECRKKGHILFIDEIELILSDRSSLSTELLDDDSKEIVEFIRTLVIEFLSTIGSNDVNLLAATNIVSNIDEAYARRFLYVIHMSLPSPEIRRQIFERYFLRYDIVVNDSTIENVLNYCMENSHNMSGSDIETVCKSLKPINSLASVRMIDIIESLNEEQKKKKLAGIDDPSKLLYEGYKKLAAYNMEDKEKTAEEKFAEESRKRNEQHQKEKDNEYDALVNAKVKYVKEYTPKKYIHTLKTTINNIQSSNYVKEPKIKKYQISEKTNNKKQIIKNHVVEPTWNKFIIQKQITQYTIKSNMVPEPKNFKKKSYIVE